MRRSYFLFVIFLCFISCAKTNENEDVDWDKIKFSENFFDYTLFLNKWPATERFDTIINRLTKYKVVHYDTAPMPIIDCFRNCIEIHVGSKDSVLIDGVLVASNEARNICFDFFENKDCLEDYPEKKLVEEPENGKMVELSKGHILLFFDLRKSTSNLQCVIVEIAKSIEDYKKVIANQWFELEYNKLSNPKRMKIDSLLQSRIRFTDFIPPLIPPVPPSTQEEIILGID